MNCSARVIRGFGVSPARAGQNPGDRGGQRRLVVSPGLGQDHLYPGDRRGHGLGEGGSRRA